MEIIFQLVVLIFSIMIHEISHGAVAFYLGDDTAKRLGRLTLNPLVHLDPVGSVLLPLLLALPRLFGIPTIVVGWAKPVPYDPRNLKNPKTGAGLIALAGPASNLLIAVVFAVLLKLAIVFELAFGLTVAFQIIIFINLLLAIFNLIPIPPMDGSKILFALLPDRYYRVQEFLERNSLILILAFLFFGLNYLGRLIALLNLLLFRLLGVL